MSGDTMPKILRDALDAALDRFANDYYSPEARARIHAIVAGMLKAEPAPQEGAVPSRGETELEIEAFRRHLEEASMPVQLATRAVVNRAREVAAIAPSGQKADRDDYNTLVACGPLYRLAAAVRELQRQEDIMRGRRGEFSHPKASTGESEKRIEGWVGEVEYDGADEGYLFYPAPDRVNVDDLRATLILHEPKGATDAAE